MVKKIVCLLVVVLLAAVGLSFYYTENALQHAQNNFIEKYSQDGHLFKLAKTGMTKKYKATGIQIEITKPELYVYLGKIDNPVIYAMFKEDDSFVLKFPEKLVFFKGYFSNKLQLDSSGEYKMALVSGDTLLSPLLSTSVKKELITANLNVKKLLPWSKNKPKNIFEVINGVTIESKDIQQFLNKELLSKQESLSVSSNWELDTQNNNYNVNLYYNTKNYLQTPVVEKISDLIWMKAEELSNGNTSSLPLYELLKSYNVAGNTTNVLAPEVSFSTRIDLKNCKDYRNCDFDLYVDNFDGSSNLSTFMLDKFSVKAKINNEDVQADLSVADFKIALSEDGYNYLINSTKRALVKDLFSKKLNPGEGYKQMYTLAKRDELAAAELLFAAYYKELFIPYEWISNLNANYDFNFSTAGENKINIKFHTALLSADNKVINSIDINKGSDKKISGKIVMSNPYESSTSLMEYYNKLINTYLGSGGYIAGLQKLKSNFPSVSSRLLSGVGDKNDNDATVINITTKEKDLGGQKMPLQFIGDTDLMSFIMQASQELGGTIESVQKQSTTVDSFAADLSDKKLGLASYIYSLRKLSNAELDQSLKYALKAKEQGFMAADPLVGFIEYLHYTKSKNMSDLRKSRQNMKLSAKNNDPYAMVSLSALLSVGEDKNPEDAKFYIEKAKDLFNNFNTSLMNDLNQLIDFNDISLSKGISFYLVAVNDLDGSIAIATDGEYTKDMIAREIEAYTLFPSLAANAIDLNKYPAGLRSYAMQQMTMAGVKVKNAPKPVVVAPPPSPTTPTAEPIKAEPSALETQGNN